VSELQDLFGSASQLYNRINSKQINTMAAQPAPVPAPSPSPPPPPPAPPRGADPDGYDATTTGDRRRQYDGMAALELEPDTYDHPHEEGEETETVGLVLQGGLGGFGNQNNRSSSSSGTAPSRRSKFAASNGGVSALQKLYHTIPERPQSFSVRNLLLLGGLAGLTFLFVDNADVALELITSGVGGQLPDESAGYQFAPHSSSFGGENNLGHPGGAKAAHEGKGVAFQDIIIPVANYGAASKSLNTENIVNSIGHYMHDEHRSPYASHLYDKPKEFLDEQQDRYVKKMDAVRKEWGAWSFEDAKFGVRPLATFDDVDYKDLPNDKLTPGSWQTDEEYVRKFIPEAKALVNRVTEGIYAEYGSPIKKKDGTVLTEEEKAERSRKWGPKIIRDGDDSNKDDPPGIATLSGVAFDGLVRKLLHALITNDEWYAVLGGHSAAAGHGNQFQQNRQITFHHLMEPVFDKLGMRLVSRNMAQGGVGTLQFSLAGKDMYGEADIMEWDSAMTEKGNTVDLWNKQAILSGERVPVILNQFHFEIMAETNGTAMMGNLGTDAEMVPPTDDQEQAKTVPYAARWLNGKEEKYNAICWEPRSDVAPLEQQDAHPASQVSWHPGFRYHQFQGRKVALILLKGLAAALDQWEAGIEADGFPLAEKYWHVGSMYNTIRENLRTHVTTPVAEGDDIRSPCEHSFQFLPRVCRVAMRGYGMWEPRAHNDNDFLNIIEPAPNGYRPSWSEKSYYSGFDVLPFNQAVPDGEVDAHLIAIATTFPAPDLDHDWVEDDHSDTNSTSNNDTPPTRRWLRAATQRAFRHKPRVIDTDAYKTAKKIPPKKSTSRRKASRRLGDGDEVITPGRGWYASGWRNLDDFCDGSAQSTCGRDAHSKCLGVGHNDNHKDVSGNSLSGWLVFTVPKMKEGIILIRMEWWCGKGNELSKDWSEVNDGKTLDDTPYNATLTRHKRILIEKEGREGIKRRQMVERQELQSEYGEVEEMGHRHRQLGKPTPDQLIHKDLKMDVAINGKITKTFDAEEWRKYIGEMSKNCAVWPILDDESMAERDWDEGDEGEPVEVGIRFRIDSQPHQGYCISHVYYA